MKVWVNIAASNNAWSSGLTPARIATLAFEAPVVEVFDVPAGSLIGRTTEYEVRANGTELWARLDLEREPEGSFHGESVLMQTPDGAVQLAMVALTTLPRGAIRAWVARRYPGKVGRL